MRQQITDPIDTQEAAVILGVTVRRIRQLAEKGTIQAVKFGRDWLISRADVEAYARERPGAGRRKREGK